MAKGPEVSLWTLSLKFSLLRAEAGIHPPQSPQKNIGEKSHFRVFSEGKVGRLGGGGGEE